MPPDVAALTRVFPVLRQVRRHRSPITIGIPSSVDPLGLRRRAFDGVARAAEPARESPAARDLASTTCSGPTRTASSCSRSCSGLRTRPPMLTVLCFRSEETGAKPFLQALLERAGRDRWSAISLEPMTETEAHTLIGGLLPADSALTDEDRGRMTREADGSPFVLEQMARYVGVNRVESGRGADVCAMFARGSMRSRRMRAASSRPSRSAAGRWRQTLICDACGIARDRQSLVDDAPLRPTSFAAAARRSGSRRITIGFARCWRRTWLPTRCGGSTASSVRALVERAQ